MAALALVVSGCASASAPRAPTATPPPATSVWFYEMAPPESDALLRIHTSALLKDKVYEPLVRRLFRAMTEQTLHAGTDMTRALEGADEMVIAIEGDEPILVLRGVPASLDPVSMTGLDGASQWKSARSRMPNVDSYELVPAEGALFVLMDRSWLMAAGEGEQRARQALGRAQGRPVAPDLDAARDTPVELRVPGQAMGRIAERNHVRTLRPIFEELRELDVSLRVTKEEAAHPSGAGVTVARQDLLTATLDYAGVEQATRAEEVVRDVVGAYARRGGKRWEWLKDATITRKEQHVSVSARLPEWALAALSQADDGLF